MIGIARFAMLLLSINFAAASTRADDLPMTGKPDKKFAAFDAAIQKFMQERDISAGVIAVRYRNQLAYERGYGWSDEAKSKKVEPNALFRIAGLSKPITAAAVRQLILQKKLTPTTKIVELLELKPLEGVTPEPRLAKVTIEHLLDHAGGGDPQTYEPMRLSSQKEMMEAMQLAQAPTPMEMARFMMGKPLQFEPGEKGRVRNCDFGFVLLALAVEKASGQSYVDFVQKRLLSQMNMRDAIPARTLRKDCNPKEVFYFHPDTGASVIEPENLEPVPLPYGAFSFENRLGTSTWVMSAGSYARFMESFEAYGNRLTGKGNWRYIGGLPGCHSIALWQPDGMKIVVFLNRDQEEGGPSYENLKDVLTQAAEQASKELSGGKPAR